LLTAVGLERSFTAVVALGPAMDFGEVVAIGPPATIVRHPRVVEAYIGTAAIERTAQPAEDGLGAL